jgi:hypothetical protein
MIPHYGGDSSGGGRGVSPFELEALKCREIYLRTRGLLGGIHPAGADVRG